MEYEYEDVRSNVIIVPTDTESIGDIVNEYALMGLDCKNKEELEDLFKMFADEMILMIDKHYTTEIALNMVERLKEIEILREDYRDL
ncbi:hypothetical protein [Paraliobacillus ryukyuensis]|uniref:hypothetical protein n=1 Tax=Paraliobacillus ryukyuensis TaxID=200904 RepID=UPI0009A86B24|nr:hypothetical protein [Paraliobacillus ryukyuensis]